MNLNTSTKSVSQKLKVISLVAFSICLFLFLFFQFSPVHSQTTGYVPLTNLPGTVDEGSGETNFATYLAGIFELSIGLAAVLAVLMITIGGIQYMSAGTMGGKSAGKERIQAALGGLLLVMTSWLILTTINPNTVNLNLDITNPEAIEVREYERAYSDDIPTNEGYYLEINKKRNDGSTVTTFEEFESKEDCRDNMGEYIEEPSDWADCVEVKINEHGDSELVFEVSDDVDPDEALEEKWYFVYYDKMLKTQGRSPSVGDLHKCTEERNTKKREVMREITINAFCYLDRGYIYNTYTFTWTQRDQSGNIINEDSYSNRNIDNCKEQLKSLQNQSRFFERNTQISECMPQELESETE